MAYTSLLPGLGDVFNACALAGVPIDMRLADAVTFFVYKDAGDQSVTLNESIGDDSSQELAKIDTIWKKPGVGGTWTKVIQTAASNYTHADATNDLIAFTVTSSMLSPGFTHVTATESDAIVLYATHLLRRPRRPEDALADTTGTEPVTPIDPVRAFINSQAAAFYSMHDADGAGNPATSSTQECDNLVPSTSDVLTRGSTTGSDTNDPVVDDPGTAQAGLRGDGIDDYGIVPSIHTPTVTEATGAYTLLMHIKVGTKGRVWGFDGPSSSRSSYLLASSGTSGQIFAVGPGGSKVAVLAGMTSGNDYVIGGQLNAGSLRAWRRGAGFGTAQDLSTIGPWSLTGDSFILRYGPSNVANGDSTVYSYVIFHSAIAESDMNDVADYMIGLRS